MAANVLTGQEYIAEGLLCMTIEVPLNERVRMGLYVHLSLTLNLKLFICYISLLFRISTDSHESAVDGRGDIPLRGGVCCATSLCSLHLPKKVGLSPLTMRTHSQAGNICLMGMRKELRHVC